MSLIINLASVYAGAALPANKKVRGGNSRFGSLRRDYDVQNVQQLPLILVDTFDLTIEDCGGIDDLSGCGLQPVCEARLSGQLCLAKSGLECRVLSEANNLTQLREIRNPTSAN